MTFAARWGRTFAKTAVWVMVLIILVGVLVAQGMGLSGVIAMLLLIAIISGYIVSRELQAEQEG